MGMTTAASAVERQMQAMVVWRSLLGVISTLSTPSTRPTNQHSKEEWTGKRQKVFEGKVLRSRKKLQKVLRSRKKHQNLFQLHPPRSLLQLLHIAINHIGKGRGGWRWSTSLPLPKSFTTPHNIRTSTQNQPKSFLHPNWPSYTF